MRFNFKKIVASMAATAMVGATLGSIASVSAAMTPADEFTQGNTAIIYGSAGASSDMVAATNIQVALGLTDSTTTTAGAPTEGDFVQLEKASTKFHIGNGILDVVSGTLTDDDLSTLLADGEYLDDDNTAHEYTQKLKMGNLSLTLFEDSDYKADVPTIGFSVASGTFVMNYTLDFSDDPDWADLASTDLNIMGKTYFISSVTTNTTLNLLDAASTTTLNSGESKTLTVEGTSYTISIQTMDSNGVIFNVNGEVTNKINTGQTFKLSDDSYISVKELIIQQWQGGDQYVEFSIGNGKIELKSGNDVKINEDSVNNLKVYLTNSNEELQQIVLEWKADDDMFITEDSSIMMPGFDNVKMSFTGMTYPAEEMFTIEKGASTYVQLNSFPLKDGTATIPILYGNGTSFTGVGKEATKKLLTTNNSQLTFDKDLHEQFVATYDDGDDSESYLVRATSFTTSDSGVTNKTTIQTYKDGSWTNKKSDAVATDVVNIGSVSLTLGTINKDDGTVAVTAGTSTNFNTLFSEEGLKVFLPVELSSLNYSQTVLQDSVHTNITAEGFTNPTTFTLRLFEEDKDGDNGQVPFNATLGWTSDKVTVSGVVGESPDGGEEIEDTDVFRSFIYGALATELLYDTGGDQDSLKVTYHGSEAAGNVFVSETGTSSGGSSSTDKVILMDSEVSGSASSRNWIVVGGSAVNTKAAQLLGVTYPAYGSAWESATGVGANSWLIRTFAHPSASGKVATLVAGYNAGDTTNAATYFTTQNPDVTVGQQYVGTTATSATSSVAS
jgi:hypothetical protein